MKTNKKTGKKEPKQPPAKKNQSPVKSVKSKGGNRLQAEADSLHPVRVGAGEPLYVPVSLNDEKQAGQTEEGASPEVLKNAETYVKTLVQNNEVEGLGPGTKTNPTHKIETNEEGQQVVVRRGFRAF